VRISLPKRILTSPSYFLYGSSLPPLLSKKAYVASCNQELARVRFQFSASTVRLDQDRTGTVLESGASCVSRWYPILPRLTSQQKSAAFPLQNGPFRLHRC